MILIIFAAVIISPQTISAQTRSPLKTVREVLMQERTDFKQRISEIKDQRKRATAERIDSKITNANARMTNKMSETLNKLGRILSSIQEKARNLSAAGQDTTALNNAITQAQTAIVEAQSAVDAQAAKEYSATIGDEATLRSTVGQMVSGFRLDIQEVHKKVVDAKQAVMKAISELAKLRGERTATESANI